MNSVMRVPILLCKRGIDAYHVTRPYESVYMRYWVMAAIKTLFDSNNSISKHFIRNLRKCTFRNCSKRKLKLANASMQTGQASLDHYCSNYIKLIVFLASYKSDIGKQ